MTMINAISKKQEGETMTVHLKSGVIVGGIFEEVKDGLLKMTNVYVICNDYQYKTLRVLVDIEVVEMCMPGVERVVFSPDLI